MACIVNVNLVIYKGKPRAEENILISINKPIHCHSENLNILESTNEIFFDSVSEILENYKEIIFNITVEIYQEELNHKSKKIKISDDEPIC
jgi:hypothetical protein